MSTPRISIVVPEKAIQLSLHILHPSLVKPLPPAPFLIYMDVVALKLHAQPDGFDMIVTTNLCGDILSDAVSYWGGGPGMAPSLNWGNGIAVAEPVHGSAPNIAGKGIANPIAAILSGALLAQLVWGNIKAAARIESAVFDTLASNIDLSTGTTAITEAVLDRLKTSEVFYQ